MRRNGHHSSFDRVHRMAQAQVQEYHQREVGGITMESLQAGTVLQEQEPRGSNRWIASERGMTLSPKIQTLFRAARVITATLEPSSNATVSAGAVAAVDRNPVVVRMAEWARRQVAV